MADAITVKSEPVEVPATPPSTPKGKGSKQPRKTVTKSPRTPKGPTKAQLAKEASAKKRSGAAAWDEYCLDHQWIKQEGFKHPRPSIVLHATDAKAFFRFKEEELGTLKYEEFDHDYSSTPGRSYEKSDLHELCYRKFGMKGGFAKEADILSEGKKLFQRDTEALNARALAKNGRGRKAPAWRQIYIKRKREVEDYGFMDDYAFMFVTGLETLW